ncbi:MAG: hypothetical protein FWD29_09310 [Micrococcales bacterium]|nr:hypothetical protein [Micrococcales bacterium]
MALFAMVVVGLAVGMILWWPQSDPLSNELRSQSDPPSNSDLYWHATLCGSDDDIFNKVVVTDNGQFIALGVASSTDGDYSKMDVDAEDNALIAVWSPAGQRLSYSARSNHRYDGAIAVGDGLVVVGSELSDESSPQAYIALINSEGVPTWEHVGLPGVEPLPFFSGVTLGPDGSIIAAGHKEDPANLGHPHELFLARFSLDGTLLWSEVYEGFNVVFWSMTTTQDGSLYLAGHSRQHGWESDNDRILSSDGTAWVLRFNNGGEMLWAKAFGGEGSVVVYDVIESQSGGVIIAGSTQGKNGQFPADELGDALLIEIDPSGDIVWAQTYGGRGTEGFLGLGQVPNGDIVAVGATSSTDGDFPAPYGNGKGSTDSLIALVSSSGVLKESFHSGGRAKDMWTGVALTKSGGIVLAGYTESTDGTLRPSCGSRDPVIAYIPAL